MLRLITWVASLRFAVHRKKAHNHEATLAKLERERNQLRGRVVRDQQSAFVASRVISDEIARLGKLRQKL
jgi:hypothetical protein